MITRVPPIAAVVIHEVESFDAWLPKFQAHQAARKDAGILGHHLNRNADDPNRVAVYLPASDPDELKAFFVNDELRKAMKDAGVEGTPDIKIMKPVSLDADLSKPAASLIVVHGVEDYDKWRAAYDGFDAKRKELGITGHAVNQLADDPNEVVVYHQAESVDTLRAFMGTAELKERMKEAGVSSAPEASFWTSDAAVQY